MDHNQEGEILHSLYGRTITRYGNRVAKAGDIRAHEAPTLPFIVENTTLPVPKVHGVHYDGNNDGSGNDNGKVKAVVMDYMPGTRLDETWDTLTPDLKGSIADELHGFFLRGMKENI